MNRKGGGYENNFPCLKWVVHNVICLRIPASYYYSLFSFLSTGDLYF